MSKQTFDFSEALRRMKEGKKVRRISLKTTTGICVAGKNLSVIYKHATELIPHEIPSSWHFFSLNDVLATDWEEVEG